MEGQINILKRMLWVSRIRGKFGNMRKVSLKYLLNFSIQ